MSEIIDSKLSGETKTYYFDFTSQLALGETISTKSVVAAVYSGTDSSPSSVISGSAAHSGGIVSQKITAGTTGVIYVLVAVITTSLSQTLELTAFLAVL